MLFNSLHEKNRVMCFRNQIYIIENPFLFIFCERRVFKGKQWPKCSNEWFLAGFIWNSPKTLPEVYIFQMRI